MKRTALKRASRSASRPFRSSRRVTRWLFGAEVGVRWGATRAHSQIWDGSADALEHVVTSRLSPGEVYVLKRAQA